MSSKKLKTEVNDEEMDAISEDIGENGQQKIDQTKDNASVKPLANPEHSKTDISPFVLMSLIKCPVKDCTAFCSNESTLKNHLEVNHKLKAEPSKHNSKKRINSSYLTIDKKSPIRFRGCNIKTEINVTLSVDRSFVKSSLLEKSTLGSGCHIDRQTKEVILNLNEYFKSNLPNATQEMRLQIISNATKISGMSLKRVLTEFKTTGTVKKPEAKKPGKRFSYNDEDREILSRIIYKQKDENRLTGLRSVYREMTTSNEFNPTFKKCCSDTFTDIFKSYGFRIARDRIIDIKPSDTERERIACQKKESGSDKYVCDWPGCQKEFNQSQHMITHLRIHTGIKPYVCRFQKCDYRCAAAQNFSKHLKGHNKTVFPDDSQEFV